MSNYLTTAGIIALVSEKIGVPVETMEAGMKAFCQKYGLAFDLSGPCPSDHRVAVLARNTAEGLEWARYNR